MKYVVLLSVLCADFTLFEIFGEKIGKINLQSHKLERAAGFFIGGRAGGKIKLRIGFYKYAAIERVLRRRAFY